MVEALNNPAFEILSDIEQRSYSSASAVPRSEQSGRFWTGIGFRLNKNRYVAPLQEVAEILRMPNYTKVPGARSWVKGVANIRGTLLPIMDLHGFLGRKTPSSVRQQRVLVVNHNGVNSGIIVDEVLGLQHFEDSERLSEVEDDENIMPYLSGRFERADDEWHVFSPFALTEHPDFLKVAL
ncbi:chemotaxis protein CheW [Pleionea mediterranea]|jgi:twitching motility protein PilI|uniref:Twitching motility protein PilI n=1 Tax=Pleionea mediterranea TaxID=523701 RepID=A0A316FGN8_9GAMM|nr:chemotaxis protein CheW [Pleionea mediterranea]PWK46876.1 twitching motility protein PilI [Pleionea mediterranea]